MKKFFHQYSYSIVKMFVNQFAISVFGIILAMATTATNNTILTIAASVFSILFYLFLLYTLLWEIGAKDRISVDYGKKEYHPNTGFFIALIANIPNLLIALLYMIAYPFSTTHVWAGTLNTVIGIVSAIIEGMYTGLLSAISIPSLGVPLLRCWWSYFLIIVPALVTAWIAYFAGFKNFRILATYFNKRNDQ